MTAHQFQRYIADKDVDLRVTAVGERLFPVSIRARTPTARVDWRCDYDGLDYEVVEMPNDVAAGLRAYLAALLCHRLGDRNVFSLDINPGLLTTAHARLVGLGYQPHLACLDGADGWTAHAPYDRIIATCGISTIPYPWVAQTRPGGLILTEALSGATACWYASPSPMTAPLAGIS
ncbi:MAG: hypothetical protein ACRD0H_18560 [Actinomycetes bacterium]